MIEFLLLVVAIAVVILWSRMRSQRDELRSALGYLEERTSERIRQLEGRVIALERARPLQDAVAESALTAEPIREQHPVSSPDVFASQVSVPPEVVPLVVFSEQSIVTASAEEQVTVDEPVSLISSQQSPPLQESSVQFAEKSAKAPLPPPVPVSEGGAHIPKKEHAGGLSLEERLGANWLSKIGIVILVVGLAFFLAKRLTAMGPAGKVLTGFAIGFAVLGGSVWLERKALYRIFARAGIGGGWALIFFTTFAMYHVDAAHVLDSLVTDLLLMLLVAAGMVAHSLRHRSQTVTGLAFLLGYVTVVTSHLETNQGTVVFSLTASAVLAFGLVVVTTLRHWARLELAGLIAVLGNHFLWLSLVLPASGGAHPFPLFWPSALLILFNWAIFRAAYVLRKPLDAEEDRVSSLSAIVNAGGVLGLLKYQSVHPEWTFWALLAMGIVELSLGAWARNRRRSAFLVLSTIAIVLLVAAVPYKFQGVSWPVLWLVEAHVLALCGLRLGEPLFRRLGLLTGFISSVVLVARDVFPLVSLRLDHPDPDHHPSLTVALLIASTLFWIYGELYPRRWPELVADELEAVGLKLTSWLGMGAAATALWAVLPAEWVATGWLALVLLIGLAADWKRIENLAVQADLLAVLAVTGLFVRDFIPAPLEGHKLPVLLGIALLYGSMRRRTVLKGSPGYVAPIYSWVASLLLMNWLWRVVAEEWLTLAWVALAIALFEIGSFAKRSFLRWQGFAAAILAFFQAQLLWGGNFSAANLVQGGFQFPCPIPSRCLE